MRIWMNPEVDRETSQFVIAGSLVVITGLCGWWIVANREFFFLSLCGVFTLLVSPLMWLGRC